MTTGTPENRPRSYGKHGAYRLKAALKEAGSRTIDRRTTVGKALQAWRADLEVDLGGREVLSTQQLGLIELAVRTKLMLDSIDAWILTQGSLVDKRKRALLPVVRERSTLAASFQGLMKDLGLEKRAKPVMSLAEILRTPHPTAAEPRTIIEKEA